MSYLEKLLDGIEVEWRTLKESLVRTKGTNITAGQMKELHKDGAPLKIFAGGKTVALVDYEDIPSKDVNTEPSIIVKSRGGIEFEYYDKPFSHKNEMWSYHSQDENINIKFVYYFLKIQESYFQNIAGRMQMPQISIPDTDKFKIPIPPLEIQQKIVDILDSFTELTAELTAEVTAELTARKQQYNYYRERLLSFEENEVEWKTLNEITKIQRGKRLIKSELEESGKYAVYQNSMTPLGYYHESNVMADTTFIISAGSAGEIGYSSIDFWAADDVYYFTAHEKLVNKFLYYFLLTQQSKITGQVRRASVPRLSRTAFEKLQIPIPLIEKQQRIVSILDKFEMLTTSISEGLPKEIELRKKQYEYYRDLLLTFPKNH